MATKATIKEQYRAVMDVALAPAVIMLVALAIAVGKAMYGFSAGDASLQSVFGPAGTCAWILAIASGLMVSAHSEAIKCREEALLRARLRSQYGECH